MHVYVWETWSAFFTEPFNGYLQNVVGMLMAPHMR